MKKILRNGEPNSLKKYTFLLCFMLQGLMIFAQQNLRGTIIDRESKQPLQGVSIQLISESLTGYENTTDAAGNFTIMNIPVGRYNFNITLKGYRTEYLQNIIINQGKETILNIELDQQGEELKQASVTSKKGKGQVSNEMSLVSSRQFTVDETDRFAGSRGDPARMASNFAGVQGADDSRNDIVVRGNSPQGVLWRVEGVDIPNPNHFAIPGTTGGPVSMINNKILSNSDFYTGAFPAEYGNSTAGVFDLKLRNGNNKRHERSTQFGFLGWDLMMEGPLSKKSKASYLVTYRYSTLALFSKLNIKLGTDAVPIYQDASFKLNFPLKNNKGSFSVFGITGTSAIDINISKKKYSATDDLYGQDDRDQQFSSKAFFGGVNFLYSINKKSYLKVTSIFTTQSQITTHELVYRHVDSTDVNNKKYALDSITPNLGYTFNQKTINTHILYNARLTRKTTFRAGLILNTNIAHYIDSATNFDTSSANFGKWSTRWNTQSDVSNLLQLYAQVKHNFNSKLSGTLGLHAQYFTLGKASSLFEPRLGLKYLLNNRSSLSFGMGVHSQIQPLYTYYYILPGNTTPHNLNMGLTKSNHYVLSYDLRVSKSTRFKFETYYQQLYNIPVEVKSSSFSLVNTGSAFSRFFPGKLQNMGTGCNYGVEFTLEKSFTRGYYYITTLSLFDAKYKGSDGVLRSSDFNTNSAFNALLAKEWLFNTKGKNKHSLNVGGKFTYAGARRFSPIDLAESIKQREYVELDSLKNTKRFDKPYIRFDLRISYKINSKHLTHEFAIDIINLFNYKNVLKYTYVPNSPYEKVDYQLGRLPLFYYKLDF
ncbi:MAG: carboxypeptidase regulatory-like domain-containing protein [Bacteroidota bacterium]|nr:carboxypeptidase regulatory-like domain-containing protein [Bacteroidota bacterium]